MNFEKLKKEINNSQNKKDFIGTLPPLNLDSFLIVSSLYYTEIYCYDVKTVNDIYDVVNKYELDPYLFHSPFYIKVVLEKFDEDTVNIINQLDENVFIEITSIRNIDIKNFELLSKIKHKNIIYYFNGCITQDVIELWTSDFLIEQTSCPTLLIEKIDFKTVNIIKKYCNLFYNYSFRIEIKDSNSLKNLHSIIPYIPENKIFIQLDDNIFNEKNPTNARDLIVQNEKMVLPENKKLNIYFRKIHYDTIEQIYELEKRIELIKSHIPSTANELDIITYISLFIINYFHYDYEMYEKAIKREEFEDINLTQFISVGKGVCRHFASFTKYILNSLEIECEELSSLGDYYNNPDSEGHAFNVVKINGKSYFLDNTWLAETIQSGQISSLAESSNFLSSNEIFGHKEYEDVLLDYQCDNYDREEIKRSVNRAMQWNNNYKIHLSSLKDLFRKHILKKEKSIEDKIEEAIPRRR